MEDNRFKQATKEAAISGLLFVFFFVWWYCTAYGMGNTRVFGFPSWFFYSCIVGYVGISILLWVVVKLFFKEVSLESDADEKAPASFVEKYYIGSRDMGGIMLAMAIVTSYMSASSFIGGSGVAWKVGLGWVLLAMIQVPTVFFTLGVLGKKFAIVSRQMGAVTLTDYLRARYKSDTVAVLASAAVLVFFFASMLAQFIGGAKLFTSFTGVPYFWGLVLFGVTVVIYTSLGGFRAVVVTDLIQGILMLVACVVLLYGAAAAGGGINSIMDKLAAIDPGLISPYGAGNSVPQPFILSFWVLVGVAVIGLPQTAQKCIAYRDSRSMHRAMVIGTVVCGFMLLAVHLAGVMGRAILPSIGDPEMIIPTLTQTLLSPFWAVVFIAGPLAAVMSTIDSMLLIASAAIVKDIYLHYRPKALSQKQLKRTTFGITFIIGVLVFIGAMYPPEFLVWIILFAFGGLEAVFVCPLLFGLYWKRANASGAIWSMVGGCLVYFVLMGFKIQPLRIHPIVPTLAVAVVTFVIASFMGQTKKNENI